MFSRGINRRRRKIVEIRVILRGLSREGEDRVRKWSWGRVRKGMEVKRNWDVAD